MASAVSLDVHLVVPLGPSGRLELKIHADDVATLTALDQRFVIDVLGKTAALAARAAGGKP